MFTPVYRRALGAAALALACAVPVQAADHRDGTIAQDMPADIADTYVFLNPNDPSMVVIGVTVNPYIVSGVTGAFSSDVLYQLKIDNDGDFREDLVIQALYDVSNNNQNVTLIGPGRPKKVGAINALLRATGNPRKFADRGRGPTVTVASNAQVHDVTLGHHRARVFSGRTDDPFFIDLIWVRSLLGVIPPIPRLLPVLSGEEPGRDLFTGLNVSSLMIELPVEALFSSRPCASGHGDDDDDDDDDDDGKKQKKHKGGGAACDANGVPFINVWSTASRNQITLRRTSGDRDRGKWVQIDREGFPALNAALVPPPLRDQFNRDVPANDLAYEDAVRGVIAAAGPQDENGNRVPLGLNQDVAGLLLPDVLRLSLDPGAGDFNSLNGRTPADDFIDTYVAALTGGAVTTGDGVPGNDPSNTDVDGDGTPDDVTGDNFPDIFPFLSLEHIAGEGIPAGSRN